MSLHKLTAGDGYTYLTRQVAAVDSTETFSSLADYYAAKGEAPGIWMGAGLESLGVSGQVTEQQMLNLFGQGLHPDADRIMEEKLAAGATPDEALAAARLGKKYLVYEGNDAWRTGLREGYQAYNRQIGNKLADPVPLEIKSQVRSEVARKLFTAEHGRDPLEHELSAFVAQVSRPVSSAVAGFDVTFSPVKSVSTLWAVAPLEMAQKIEAAHLAAVSRTLEWLQKEVAFTRVGPGGVAQVDTKGLSMAAFTHRDSRAGDPDLHTHVAIANKVETLDGRWFSLDARMLYRFNVAGSEFYNTVLEAEFVSRLGGHFEERSMGPGKRSIREVAGVDLGLNALFSSRRAAIDAHRPGLVDKFLADHGRLPTVIEMTEINQRANLDTRQAKHEPRSLAEQRATWRAQALDYFGSEQALEMMLDGLDVPLQVTPLTPQLLTELVTKTVEVVSGARARWRWSNLSTEALRQVRYAGLDPETVEQVAHQVADIAASTEHSVPIRMATALDDSAVPAGLRRVDADPQHAARRGQHYTSTAILDAETRIIAAAGRGGFRALSPTAAQVGLLEWTANTGRTLNTGQEAALMAIATSDRALLSLISAAGTGKSTLMSAVARTLMASGMSIVGLAPEASAAQQLGREIDGIETDTVSKVVFDLAQVDPEEWQPWMKGIGPDTLVIVDEAALEGTNNLDVLTRFVNGRGGRVLLVGDDQQRAASAAGGVLRDIEVTHGALTLNEVMRFDNELEGEASLALRAGDPGAAGFYNDRGRLHPVTPDTAVDVVYRAWAADQAAGLDALMIAQQLDVVGQLNARARADRLTAAGGVQGLEIELANGEFVSAGDIIVTKQNSRTLSMGGTDFVRNNYRWTVDEILPDGAIRATKLGRKASRVLPAWYLEKGQVRLGYAHTSASVQGLTADTAKLLGDASMTRNEFYPGMTRGRQGNDFYLQIGGQGDTHDITKPEAVSPATMVEIVEKIITTDGSARSATTEIREAHDPALLLGDAGNAYVHTIVVAAETLIGPERLAQIVAAAEQAVPGITHAPAWDTLRGHLVVLAASGKDPIKELTDAAAARELKTADDIAAVLDWRLDHSGNHSQGSGPLPWLPAIPTDVLGLPEYAKYLPAREQLVTDYATGIRSAVAGWTVETSPAWAVPYLSNPALTADLAVWRASRNVPESDLRPAGDEPLSRTLRGWHNKMVIRAVREVGDPTDGADRWATLLHHHGINLSRDSWWPVLAARLTAADHAGLNVPALLAEAIAYSPHDGPATLPAETTASSLWWRLAVNRQVGSLAVGPSQAGHQLRPSWTPRLTEILGERVAERVMADRLWPIIVTHVDVAARDGLNTDHVVDTAAAMLAAHHGTTRPHELAELLLWQLGLVTDPRPADIPDHGDEPEYPDPLDAETESDDSDTRPERTHGPVPVDAGHTAPDTGVEQTGTDPADADPFDADAYAAQAAAFDAEHDDHPAPEPTDLEPAEPTEPTPSVALAPAPPPPTVAPDAAARLYEVNAAAHTYYLAQAPGSWVPGYITARGLDPADVGSAPNRFDALYNAMRLQGFTDTELLAAGLVKHSERGNLIDRYRDRAMLPYYTPAGDIAGFTGRLNPDHIHHNPDRPDPKYMNGPETDVFAKRELPFGLTPAAVAAIRGGADITLVEGPFDAYAITAAAAAAGANIVGIAAAGTALTVDQLHALAEPGPLTQRRIIEALDSDPAGRAAAFTAHATLAAAGVHDAVQTTGLTGKDPAQMLTDQGPDALLAALTQVRPLADHVVDTRVALHHIEDGFVESSVGALHDAARWVAAMPLEEQSHQAGRLAEQLDIDPFRVLDAVYGATPIRTPAPNPIPDTGPLGLPTPPVLTTARYTAEQAAAIDQRVQQQVDQLDTSLPGLSSDTALSGAVQQLADRLATLDRPQSLPPRPQPPTVADAAQESDFNERLRRIDQRLAERDATRTTATADLDPDVDRGTSAEVE